MNIYPCKTKQTTPQKNQNQNQQTLKQETTQTATLQHKSFFKATIILANCQNKALLDTNTSGCCSE